MDLKAQNILFFTRTMKLGGTENVVLQLCEIFKPLVNKIIVCSCGGVNVEKLNLMGIKHYEIPDIESKSASTLLKVTNTVINIIIKERITIVHTHHRMAAMYTSFLKPFFRFVFFVSVHGEFFDKRFFTKIAYRNSTLLACGQNVKKNLMDFYGISEEKIIVLRNAIERDTSSSVNVEIIQSLRKRGYRIAGYIGRLSEEKGVIELVESLKYYDRADKIAYIIVGTGYLENNMKKLAEKIGCLDLMFFLGYRDDPQNIIRQVDCVVLPSRTEGFPLTPMEAFANGKPVVGTSVGGIPEIVVDGHNGFLIEPIKPDRIAQAIKKVLNNDERYKALCQNAFDDYEHYFCIESFKEKIVNIYEDWLGL